jgi:hypothetical protein
VASLVLTLLLDELVASWPELVTRAGRRDLHGRDPREVRAIWPQLRLVSCWGDGHAKLAAGNLAARLPGVRLQIKGLLATEGVVTIPWGERHPVAVTSHFYEFIDDDGAVCGVGQLREGLTYGVVLTTSGGLWRYRLGDRVLVDGRVGGTPSLRFVGRIGGVSDRRGEKLVEPFVAGVLAELWAGEAPPRFALLAPEEDERGCYYALFVEGDAPPVDPARLDAALGANPHYAWCRELGQLGPARVFAIRGGGFETFVRRQADGRCRIGDVKPAALSTHSGWSRWFAGGWRDHVAIALR